LLWVGVSGIVLFLSLLAFPNATGRVSPVVAYGFGAFGVVVLCGRAFPTWSDRGFAMWPLYDKRGLPWPLFDKQGRPRTWVVSPLFVFMTAAWILVAIAVTLYSGLAYAAIYWILSGFFLSLLAAGLFVFLMKRRQEAKIR